MLNVGASTPSQPSATMAKKYRHSGRAISAQEVPSRARL
jgi:hypothetical protein